MKNWSYCLGINLLLTIGIFFCALLGRSLGIQGPALAISVIWPATGLSLAALLLFGPCASLGVLAGNLLYNLLFLVKYPSDVILTSFHDVIAATFISLGSLIQALLGAYIMRAYSTGLMFRTVQDIFIFLIPASMLSCLIGSTVGVTTLVIVGGLDWHLIFPVWLTFWLGDTVGIYVITPLIVIWSLQNHDVKFSKHIPSIVCMTVLFIGSLMATYFLGPLPHLFVPLSIWAAYLFRMHGASLAIFFMTTSSVLFAVFLGNDGISLTSLISFIGVTISAPLIIAAVVNERAKAWNLLDSRNLYLEKEISIKVVIIDQIRSEVFRNRKISIQNPVPASLTLKVQAALSQMEHATNALEKIQKSVNDENLFDDVKKKNFTENLKKIRQGLSDINDLRKMISEIRSP